MKIIFYRAYFVINNAIDIIEFYCIYIKVKFNLLMITFTVLKFFGTFSAILYNENG